MSESVTYKVKGYLKATKNKRISIFVAFLILNIIITLAGVFTPLSYDTAQVIVNEVESLFEDLTSLFILENNLSIALVGFIPIVGILWMFYVLYSTGLGFSAFSIVYEIPSLVVILATFITPVFWLEYIAYSLALTEGTMILLTILKNRENIRQELIIALIFIGLVTLLLALGALIEVLMIGAL